MLELAIKHKDKLQVLFNNTGQEDRYKFFRSYEYVDEMKIDDSTYNKHQYVSINKSGNIIGYIGYSVQRTARVISSLVIINFTDEKIAFGLDVRQAFEDIFCKFNFHKLEFSVIVGNPIEKQYDRIVKKFGGRIVGTFKDSCVLFDNNHYDIKYYEILKSDYTKSTKRK